MESTSGLLYRQVRVGQYGRPFTLYKVRTIPGGGIRRFLRRTGLDELPQVFNVLRGDMRLFGPRPEVPAWDRYYSFAVPLWNERYRAKPGLLGLAQVHGTVRGTNRFSIEAKTKQAALDAYMIDNWSIGMACRILLRLPMAVWKGQHG